MGACLHPDRAAGGDRHHRHSRGNVAAGLEPRQRQGARCQLHFQPQTVGRHVAALHRR